MRLRLGDNNLRLSCIDQPITMHFRLLLLLIIAFPFFQGASLNAQVSLGAGLGITRTKFSGDQPTNGSFGPKLGPIAGLKFN